MTAPFKVVIPARYASTRLPGKPLLSIAGKPMIIHVCERAQQAGAEDVIVATDDKRILDTVQSLGYQAVMTGTEHQSGTERIAEVIRLCHWSQDTIVVNVQGDEPLIDPETISILAQGLISQSEFEMATIAAEITNLDEIFNPNAVKVVVDGNNRALYFSRAPIPWDRDNFGETELVMPDAMPYLRHIGLYAYRVGFLQQYITWQPSPLETIEALEQLRILWHGQPIAVMKVTQAAPAGVDTEDDLIRVENILKSTTI